MFAQTGMATGDQLTKHLFHIFHRIDIRPRINMSAHDDCSLHQRILDVALRFRIAGDEDPVSADPPAVVMDAGDHTRIAAGDAHSIQRLIQTYLLQGRSTPFLPH